jgi:hypothetical protein
MQTMLLAMFPFKDLTLTKTNGTHALIPTALRVSGASLPKLMEA